MRVDCQDQQEGIIRNILMRHINANPKMLIQGISIEDSDRASEAVVADIFSVERNDRAMQELMIAAQHPRRA